MKEFYFTVASYICIPTITVLIVAVIAQILYNIIQWIDDLIIIT